MTAWKWLASFAPFWIAASVAAAQHAPAGAWTTAGPSGVDVVALASDPTNALHLFAGTELGVFRTDDGGGTWPATPVGPANVVALALDPTNPDHVWAATDAGVALSTDGGATFGWLSTAAGLSTIAVDPVDPSVAYVAGNGGVVAKTTNGGETWEGHFTSDNVRRIAELIIDPGNSSHIVAAVAEAEFTYFDYLLPEVLGSSDAGKSWSTLLGRQGSGLPYKGIMESTTVAFDPRGNGTLYASVANRVYRSADGGTTWQTSSQRLGTVVTSVIVDPRQFGTLFAGTDQGVFRSSDEGAHWESLGGSSAFSVNALAFDADRAVIHAATSNGVWELALAPPTPSSPCENSAFVLCLLGGRFSARVDAWDPRQGILTTGTAVPETDGYGFFSFPELTGGAALPEVLVKMVDAEVPPWNSNWVFFGSLTDVPFVLTVIDAVTGQANVYQNSSDHPFCGGADTAAFSAAVSSAGGSVTSPKRPLEADGDTLTLLGGRLEVQMTASDPRTGQPVAGTAIAGDDDRSGYFSLPGLTGDAMLPEVVAKAIDATSLTGTLWFFYSGLTSVPYTLTVHNTVTGETVQKTAAGPFCGGADTSMPSGGSE